jgi:hypothetical protein
MTLDELMKAVDELTPDELRQLREYIERQEHKGSILMPWNRFLLNCVRRSAKMT